MIRWIIRYVCGSAAAALECPKCFSLLQAHFVAGNYLDCESPTCEDH